MALWLFRLVSTFLKRCESSLRIVQILGVQNTCMLCDSAKHPVACLETWDWPHCTYLTQNTKRGKLCALDILLSPQHIHFEISGSFFQVRNWFLWPIASNAKLLQYVVSSISKSLCWPVRIPLGHLGKDLFESEFDQIIEVETVGREELEAKQTRPVLQIPALKGDLGWWWSELYFLITKTSKGSAKRFQEIPRFQLKGFQVKVPRGSKVPHGSAST